MTVDLQRASKRVAALEQERSSFFPMWQDLTHHFLVHRGRYELGKENDGRRKDNQLQNNRPCLARRVLSAGMMSGITSPARPWFRLSTGDDALDKDYDVRVWLHDTADAMYRAFSLSNLYNSLQTCYNELCTFGTSAIGVFEDDARFLRFHTQTAGQFALGVGADEDVQSFSLRQRKSVSTVVKEYGYENCPQVVKTMWDSGQLTERVEILYLVEPNDNRDRTSPFAGDLPYRAITWMVGEHRKPLRVSGFEEFPYMTPRWDKAPGDVYGTSSPAILALGDAMALQLTERDILAAMDYEAEPPLLADVTLRQTLGDSTPRPGKMYYTANPGSAVRNLYDQYRPQIGLMGSEAKRFEQRINDAFYVDLFLLLSSTDRRQMTAREVAEKHEEKLLQLGPVLERVHNELLDPLITRSFAILERKGIIPLPPAALEGRDISVEYVSVMAQAQRLATLQGMERTLQFAGGLAQFDPSAAKYPNVGKLLSKYSDIVGNDPEILKPEEEVQAEMEAVQQQQKTQEGMAAAAQMASAAKDASKAKTSGDNALAEIMKRAGSGL